MKTKRAPGDVVGEWTLVRYAALGRWRVRHSCGVEGLRAPSVLEKTRCPACAQ